LGHFISLNNSNSFLLTGKKSLSPIYYLKTDLIFVMMKGTINQGIGAGAGAAGAEGFQVEPELDFLPSAPADL